MSQHLVQQASWGQKLRMECAMRRFGEPTIQDVSDRRGGRTAWSCVAVVQGTQFPAKYWYDGAFLDQAREDASEVAFKALSVNASTPTGASNNAYYPQMKVLDLIASC